MNSLDIKFLQDCDPLFQAIGSWVGHKFGHSGKCIFLMVDGKRLMFNPLSSDHDYTIDLLIEDVTNITWPSDFG